jgi:cell wall-associated NlpC family hydrolase
MWASRLTKWLAVGLAALVFGPVAPAPAADSSLGEKIKDFFASPTPTPSHRKHKRKSASPSPSPSPSPKAKHKASPTPTPEEEETPSFSPKPKHKTSPTPEPQEEETPTPKSKRKRHSPTPTPTETPTPSPQRKKHSPTPAPSPTETPTPTSENEESPSPPPEEGSPPPSAKVATISSDDIEGYDRNPGPVRKLLEDALELTRRDLDYAYGSADPEQGGMDCSGFIYYVLRKNGVSDVPRDASGQYAWVRKSGNFRAVLSRNIDSFELDELKPGDLLFWTGTYSIERDPPVTHTMIYLGKKKKGGQPVMVGSSDGRTYEGKQQFGVSVFDFKAGHVKEGGKTEGGPRFVGYGKIPGLGEEQSNDSKKAEENEK